MALEIINYTLCLGVIEVSLDVSERTKYLVKVVDLVLNKKN